MSMSNVIEMADGIVAALAKDAARTDRGGDRAYSGTVWAKSGVRVYVKSSSGEDIGYIDVQESGAHGYRSIKRGAAACQSAVARGMVL